MHGIDTLDTPRTNLCVYIYIYTHVFLNAYIQYVTCYDPDKKCNLTDATPHVLPPQQAACFSVKCPAPSETQFTTLDVFWTLWLACWKQLIYNQSGFL